MKYLYVTQIVAVEKEAWREFDAVWRLYPVCIIATDRYVL